jgi:hypothetical protein
MFNFVGQLQELRSTIIGLVLLLGATIIGFVWISIGLNHWLSEHLGSVCGPIVLGLIYFLPITIFAFIKAFVRQPKPVPHNETVDIATANIAAVTENLSGFSPFATGIAVVIASFLAARFPALLAVFMQMLTAYTDDVKNRAAKSAAKTDSDSTQV